MNELGVRQVKTAVSLTREALGESYREARRAGRQFQIGVQASWCALTGRHDWSEWRPSPTPFTPPERRFCNRCCGTEHRGAWPEIRVEAGSMRPDLNFFSWLEDGP
jgi:hypothetical protein